MRLGSLFTGYGGLDAAALSVLGGTVAWHSDIEPASVRLLEHHWPDVPNLGDITAVDWSQVEPVDVLTGGFPCQDLSAAGKRAGMRPGNRSGLWEHMAYGIAQLRPSMVVIENVRGLLSAEAHSDVQPCPWCLGDGSGEPMRALGAVLGDLAGLGYDARWCGVRASDVGAPHGRFRVFITATYANGIREYRGRGWPAGLTNKHQPAPNPPGNGWDEGRPEPAGVIRGSDAALSGDAPANSNGSGGEAFSGRSGTGNARRLQPVVSGGTNWGSYEPAIRRWERVLGRSAPAPTEPGRTGQRLSPHFVEWMQGLPAGHVTQVPGLSRNEQLKLLGNGVVPQQAEAALRLLLPLAVAA